MCAPNVRSRSNAVWRAACVAVAVAFLALSDRATADDGDVPMKAQAQSLFDEGRRLTGLGKYDEACPKFAESQRLNPGIGTRYYLADCLEHTGKLATAWALYVEVAGLAKIAKQKERADHAEARANALKPKLTRMVVIVPDDVQAITGIEIRRDEVVIGAASWGVALPVDPGKHIISVAAPGKRRWDSTVEASGEGATISVVIPALKDEANAVSPSATAQPTAEPALPPTAAPVPTVTASSTVVPTGPTASPTSSAGASRDRPASTTFGMQRTLALIAAGAGAVGLTLGAGFGADAFVKIGTTKEHCSGGKPDKCDATGVAAMHGAEGSAAAADVAFAVGSLAVIAGVVLFVTAPSASPKKTGVRVQLAPSVATSTGGLVLRGSW